MVLLKVEQGSCSRAGSKQKLFNNIFELKQCARAEHTSKKSDRKGSTYLSLHKLCYQPACISPPSLCSVFLMTLQRGSLSHPNLLWPHSPPCTCSQQILLSHWHAVGCSPCNGGLSSLQMWIQVFSEGSG